MNNIPTGSNEYPFKQQINIGSDQEKIQNPVSKENWEKGRAGKIIGGM